MKMKKLKIDCLYMQLNQSSKTINSSKQIFKHLLRATFDLTVSMGLRMSLISSIEAFTLRSNGLKTDYRN